MHTQFVRYIYIYVFFIGFTELFVHTARKLWLRANALAKYALKATDDNNGNSSSTVIASLSPLAAL